MNVFNMINGGGGSGSGLYVWKKYADSTRADFIGYVISEDSTTYPDGVEQGGFYYEKASFPAIETLRCSKFETGTFTPTSNTYNYALSHSLGAIPRFGFVIAESFPSDAHVKRVAYLTRASGTEYYAAYESNRSSPITSTGGTANTTTFRMYCNSSYGYFISGVTYRYVLLA